MGIADPKTLFAIADAVAEGDTRQALLETDGFLNKGKEVQNFLEELTMHFRSLLICKSVSEPAEILERTPEAAARFQAQAEKFSTEQILYMIGVLSESLAQAKWMSTPQVAAEVAMVKLCKPEQSTEPDALLARIGKLERMLAQGVPAVQTAPPTAVVHEEAEDTPPWVAEEPSLQSEKTIQKNDVTVLEEETPSVPAGSTDVWELWADALQEVKGESKMLYAFMSNAKGFINADVIEIELANQVAYDRISTPQGLEYLSQLFSRVAGRPLRAEAYLAGEREKKKEETVSIFDLAKKKDLLGDKLQIIE